MSTSFKNKSTKLYILKDPRFPYTIRYVGITVTSLKSRLNRHISQETKDNPKTYKTRWINKLLKEKIRPVIELVKEYTTWNEGCKAEISLITKLKLEKHPLTNGTSGGDGMLGVKHNKSFKKKLSLRNKILKKGNKNSCIPIYQYSLDGDFIKKWESAVQYAKSMDVDNSHVSRSIKMNKACYGFQFKYSFLGNKIDKYVKSRKTKKEN